MSFLALSGAQALIVALLVSGLVIALFFLRLRRHRVLVGSSLLWDRVVERQSTRSLMERLRRLLSLLLALAIALAIALGAGRPYLGEAGTAARSVAIVLDNSASMATRTGDGRTRLDRARDLARDLVSERAPLDGFLIADTAGRVHTPLTRDPDVLSRVLASIQVLPGAHAFPALPADDIETYLVGDGVTPLEVPGPVIRLSAFEPAANVGITAFDVAVDPTTGSGYRIAADIVNFGSEDAEVRAVLSGSGDDRLVWARRLGPGELWQESLDPAGFSGGPLRLRLESPGDALELDDTAFAYLPPERHTRLALVTRQVGSQLETLLSLVPGLDLRVMSPEVYGGPDPEIDLYAFAGFTPEVPPDAPAIYFGVEARPWLPAARGRAEDPEITSWDRDHPVLRDVSLRDLRIEEAPILEPDGWTVLAASGETPLLLAGDTPSRSIVVGFRLERSDVAFHLGFPIFVGNAVEWLSGDSLAQATELGAITVPERADTLIRLDGSAVRFTYEFGQTLFEAVSPDFFTMGVEGRRVRIAASLRSRANSDVNRGSGTVGSPPVSATGRELWRWMLGAAALLAALEWWTYQRRMTL